MKALYIQEKFESNEETIEIISFLLGKVDVCENAEEGLKKFHSKFDDSILYDVIFINYHSIILDGYYITDEILKKNNNQKIIIITDKTNLHFMKTLLNKGVDNFLLNPVDEAQLVEVLKFTNILELNSQVEYNVSNKNAHKDFLYDTLTGLGNRKKLESDLSCDTLPIVILIDIDKLSIINEIYGLEVGNKVIAELCIFLKDFAKENHYQLYRISGEGFALADCVEVLDIIKYQNDFSSLFHKIDDFKIKHNEEYIAINITAGISMVQGQPLEKATIALNHAKKTKKNYIVYSNMLDMKKKKISDLRWRDTLKKSIASNNIISVYQAIMDEKKNILKYEALMRIKNDQGELISPFHFLDVAVDTKQYTTISTIMVRKALQDAIYCNCDISLNLTYTDILNHQFTDEIKKFICKNKIGKKLIFEIVESEYIEDYDLLDNFICKFREIGVRIAIDDFGSGFSNFEYILKIKPEYIKIDGSLVRQIEYDNDSLLLVESIIDLAHKLNIKIICEYVATKSIFKILKNLKVDEYQGYYLHKPQEILFS